MRKKFTLPFFLLMLLSMSNLRAQLAPGSIAPDFTGTDITGQTWTLYDLLDQGKNVIIEFTSTQDETSWNYYNTQTLQNLYSAYGPSGTNEMVVLFIEGDASTNTDCLTDAPGCNAGTTGNWVANANYPIFDDASIAELYEVTNFPTIYHICPTRIINEIGLIADVSEIYGFNSTCDPVTGNNNAALLEYSGFEGIFCRQITFTPSALFQNMGAAEMTSATFTMTIDGAPFSIKQWTGSLNTYQIASITFEEITLSSATNIGIFVSMVNNVEDEDPSNNMVDGDLTLALDVDNVLVTLEYTTDDFPAESYWEMLDGNDQVIYSGGNSGIFTGEDTPETYTPATTYTLELALPADGCYRFVAYDRYGDGMCCQYGDGGYVLRDADGNTMFSGAEFGFFAQHQFEVKNASPIENNAHIVLYQGERGVYCQVLTFTPELIIQNLGNNEITSLSIEVTGAGASQTIDWVGNLASLESIAIPMNQLTLTGSADLAFTITEVNGAPDDYSFGNEYVVSLSRVPVTEFQTVNVRIVTDDYGYETYWQIRDDAGTVFAEGGNELVGPDGGGLQIAEEGNPGAYGPNETIDVMVELPAEGCYAFLIVDDYGDGMCCEYGEGSFRVTDQDNVVLAQGEQYEDFVSSAFEVDVVVGVETLAGLEDLALFPNPVQTELTLNFDLNKTSTLQLDIHNALGQLVQTVAMAEFVAGRHTLRIPATDLVNGIYLLTFSNGGQSTGKRFVVQH